MKINKKISKLILVFLAIFNLSACGFNVIYKEDLAKNSISYSKELAAIGIKKNRGKLDQQLKNSLYDVFNPDSLDVKTKYFLSFEIKETTSPTFITATGASGRNKITIQVNYIFKNLENAMTISNGYTSVNDNIDVTSNRYATVINNDYAKSNLVKIAAQNIRNLIVNDLTEVKKRCEKNLMTFECPLPKDLVSNK